MTLCWGGGGTGGVDVSYFVSTRLCNLIHYQIIPLAVELLLEINYKPAMLYFFF
jgi:hypothetical protein